MTKKSDNNELERLKREVSLFTLVSQCGLEMKRISADEYAVLCPFHADNIPSMHINNRKNVFHCKGCGKSGSVIDWIILTRVVDTAEAIHILKEEYSNGSGGRNGKALYSTEQEPVNLLEVRHQRALSPAVDFWHNNFKNTKEGAEYLVKRGLVYGEIVDSFKIGYSDGSLAAAINDESILETLKELGIIRDGTEHFAGRVVFPVFDAEKNIVQIYGRNIGPKGPKHLYMKAPLAGLYNPQGLGGNVILAESIIDALSILSLGYGNTVSSFGANGLKDEVFDLLERKSVRRIYIAYDPDTAGNTAAASLAERFIQRKIESQRIEFPENTDANDFIRRIDEPQQKFAALLEEAPSLKRLTDEALSESERNESLEKKGNEYHYRVGPRRYTIRGLENNKTDSQMKIFLRLDCEDRFHIDNNLDLFSARTTGSFVKAAAGRLSLDERVIRADLDRLTDGLDDILKKEIEERDKRRGQQKMEFHKNLVLAQRAREFLSDPLFIVRFVEDIESAGLVGESLNMFFGYVATFSRHMRHQLHAIIQSESSAGKSTVLNLIAELVPEEDSIYFTQVTPRSLYYGPPGFLKNKCIFIAEADGLAEAEFPIKQLMSEGKLAISYTKTDPSTGEHTSEVKENEGPAQFNITEPRERLHEEIENRSTVMILDMSLEQTERILAFQRLLHSPEGVEIRRKKDEICNFYRHVQREIEPFDILNPYSPYLIYNAGNHQARRDNQKYLTFLDCITLMFQHQREKVMRNGRPCLVTHIIDIAITHFLIRHVFTKSLDELPAQTGNFVQMITEHYRNYAQKNELDFDQVWFYRRDMREITGLSNTRVHEHTSRLVDYEYLTFRRDQNGIAYRFLFEPDAAGNFRGLLTLASIDGLLKRASKKERQEYRDFLPSLEKIFRALDPSYKGGKEL